MDQKQDQQPGTSKEAADNEDAVMMEQEAGDGEENSRRLSVAVVTGTYNKATNTILLAAVCQETDIELPPLPKLPEPTQETQMQKSNDSKESTDSKESNDPKNFKEPEEPKKQKKCKKSKKKHHSKNKKSKEGKGPKPVNQEVQQPVELKEVMETSEKEKAEPEENKELPVVEQEMKDQTLAEDGKPVKKEVELEDAKEYDEMKQIKEELLKDGISDSSEVTEPKTIKEEAKDKKESLGEKDSQKQRDCNKKRQKRKERRAKAARQEKCYHNNIWMMDEDMEAALQHQVNVTRMIRTEEYTWRHLNFKNALMDDSFSYRSDVVTTSLYCSCDDCYKYCCYGKPLKCIDPYLMDMRYTHWIYNGLVAASRTASTRVNTTITAATKRAARTDCDEPKQKRLKR